VTGPRTRLSHSVKVYLASSWYVLITPEEYSVGARACLGRRCELLRYNCDQFSRMIFRFFETEGVAVVTMLVSKYKIEIKEEPQFAGETFEERYARITASEHGITTM